MSGAEDKPEPTLRLVLYPSQVKRAESLGLKRGSDFVVYDCLICLRPMDQCACPKHRNPK